VLADLRSRLASGEWAHGQQLPPVAELAEHYAVASRTVARALRRLADEGLVQIVPRWGVFRA
jgi:DNA-binding GntR family transcriptional regulator